MDKVMAAKGAAFFARPTLFDAGIGVLYFFTSHMVIRALYYVGLDRTPWELAAFIIVVILAIVLAHGFAGLLLKGRLAVETCFGVPAVSVVAAVGAVVALISTLPVVGVGLFYVSGALLGLACGWIVVIWSSTIHVSRPDSASFCLDPALVVAVAVYFLFRCVSSLSEAVAQGFLLALPLVALACIVRSDKPAPGRETVGGECDEGWSRPVSGLTAPRLDEQASCAEEGDEAPLRRSLLAERAQSLEVLVVVAAAFAVGCSLVVYFSGRESEYLDSGLNYMVLFETLAVAVMIFCCALMYAFAQRCNGLRPKLVAAVTIALCYGAPFAVGLLMGGAGIPSTSPDALWESNIWVLVIAIFAYDIRDSLYAVRGLAVGLMFEAMCVAQLIARVATLELTVSSLAVAGALSALYLLCVGNQLLRDGFRRDGRGTRVMPRKALSQCGGRAVETGAEAIEDPRDQGASVDDVIAGTEDSVRLSEGADAATEAGEEGVPVEIAAYCQDVAVEYGLTPREAEILALVALGRSAKYIADELQVSYNTTRTHIRHIYEKLNIHSKQELIDLVLFGSGVM